MARIGISPLNLATDSHMDVRREFPRLVDRNSSTAEALNFLKLYMGPYGRILVRDFLHSTDEFRLSEPSYKSRDVCLLYFVSSAKHSQGRKEVISIFHCHHECSADNDFAISHSARRSFCIDNSSGMDVIPESRLTNPSSFAALAKNVLGGL